MKKNTLLLLAIIALAAIIRLFTLLQVGDFWADEMFSFVYSQKSWSDSIKFWTWETNPPLHMFFLKLWWYIFPPSEFWARLPSVIFGVATIPILYLLTKKLFNNQTALLASLAVALAPLHIFYSVASRTYALMALLATAASYYFFENFYHGRANKKNLLLYVVATTLLLYSHLTGLGIIGVQLLTLLALKKKQIKKWFFATLISYSLWLVWAIPSLSLKTNIGSIQNSWYFFVNEGLFNTIESLEMFLLGPLRGIVYGSLLLLGMFVLLAITFYKQKKQNKLNINLLPIILLFILPVAMPIIIGAHHNKFYFIAFPWFAILLAYLLNYNLKPIVSALLICAIFIPGIYNYYKIFPINQWSYVAEFIDSRFNPNKKQVFIYSHFPNKDEVEYYLKTPINVLTFLPITKLSWDKFLITQNYRRLKPNQPELEDWFEKNNIAEFENIFLLFPRPNNFVDIDLVTTFKNKGYSLAGQPAYVRLAGIPIMYAFVKTE